VAAAVGTFALIIVTARPVAAVVTVPPDRVAFDTLSSHNNYEIATMAPDGAGRVMLTADPAWDSWWPKISPDRTQILFERTPAGTHDRDFAKTSLWLMNADGSNIRQLIPNGGNGWTLQGHAEWSPDGSHIALFAGTNANPQIWVVDSSGGNPRQVTNRVAQNLDPSWAPDGASLLFVGCPGSVCPQTSYEVYRINVDGSGLQRLTNDLSRDQDPYFSPDGTTIAWLRLGLDWSIFKMKPDGSQMQPVIQDLQVNSKPGWSLDSSWIFFHRQSLPSSTTFKIWKIHPDGTGLAQVPQTNLSFAPPDEYPVNSSS
jgi:Tol biopolymer transport system component